MMKHLSQAFLLLLLLHQGVSFQAGQFFETVKGVAPSTGQYYSPLASYSVRSRITCAKDCVQNPCCVALFLTKNGAQLHCSLFNIMFADTFLKEDISSTYMFRIPVNGMYTVKCPITYYISFVSNCQ